MRGWLRPLVPLYRAGSAVLDALRGKPRRLKGKVVSVGSLSAGGAGKTPVVMLVAEMLRGAGLAVDVLSRGYRRMGSGVEWVDPAGSAARFGDEPMLMARRLGVPVWVGVDRFAAGTAAEASTGGVVHVLDDGFQHRRLWRNVDVVLLTREDAEDRLLPAGNLREGLGALRRASIVVLREEEAKDLRGVVPAGKIVWVVRRTVRFAEALPQGVVVFCGIARPGDFLEMLKESGLAESSFARFKDHYRYEVPDMEILAKMGRLSGAEGFVTTEKDFVKLSGEMRRLLEQVGPVFVARLEVELVEGSVDDLLGLLL